ncbi:MAG: UbiX family flavin prenyltransferase [Bryobacteraceae bacterium]|nr:UbiX family flavin prenyltransferase [Bryobacteraceae bacterium]
MIIADLAVPKNERAGAPHPLFRIQNRRSTLEVNLKLVVGVSGASGSVYGFRLLQKLRERGGVETHLILTRTGERTGWIEMGIRAADWYKIADFHYPPENVGSRLASGSFPVSAMVVAPCSIHSMSAIAAGISGNLLVRAADVNLKERRRLVLMVREMPFHLGHLRTMVSLTEMGAIIAPPIPGFYHKPQTVMDIVDSSVERVMDLLGVSAPDARRWEPEEAGE